MCGAVPPSPPQIFNTWLMSENILNLPYLQPQLRMCEVVPPRPPQIFNT